MHRAVHAGSAKAGWWWVGIGWWEEGAVEWQNGAGAGTCRCCAGAPAARAPELEGLTIYSCKRILLLLQSIWCSCCAAVLLWAGWLWPGLRLRAPVAACRAVGLGVSGAIYVGVNVEFQGTTLNNSVRTSGGTRAVHGRDGQYVGDARLPPCVMVRSQGTAVQRSGVLSPSHPTASSVAAFRLTSPLPHRSTPLQLPPIQPPNLFSS